MGTPDNSATSIKASPSFPQPIDLSSDTEGLWSAIRVGTGGDIKVDYRDGPFNIGVVLKNCASGSWEPGTIVKIYSTANGTTAADLVAFVR